MPSIRIERELNNEMYFITFTVHNWYYVFDRHERFGVLADSLRYCQKHKDLKIYAYVFMINHLHLIVQSEDVSGFVRDFKRFTSREIMKNIIATEPDVAELFARKNNYYEFWKKTNMPILIETDTFFHQKLDYIHDNPVRKDYVSEPEHWFYSSAGFYIMGEPGPIQVEGEFVDIIRTNRT